MKMMMRRRERNGMVILVDQCELLCPLKRQSLVLYGLGMKVGFRLMEPGQDGLAFVGALYGLLRLGVSELLVAAFAVRLGLQYGSSALVLSSCMSRDH